MGTFIVVILVVGGILALIYYVLKTKDDKEIESTSKGAGTNTRKPAPLRVNITLEKYNSSFDKKYNVRVNDPILTPLAGVNHNDCEAVIKELVKKGDQLMLLPDPENKYDKTATRVCTKDGWFMGWLPNKKWNDRVFNDLQNGKKWEAFVREIRRPDREFNFYNAIIELWEYVAENSIKKESHKDEVDKEIAHDNNFGQEITFFVANISLDVLSTCEDGDYVSLWTQPDMNRVIIYAPGSVGGSGQLGIVPDKYFKTIQAHILAEKSFGNSELSLPYYDATIIDISGSSCKIKIKLYSPEEHEKLTMDFIEQEKKAIKADLEKPNKMKKPILIEFPLKQPKEQNLENLKLKIFEKEYYVEHPFDYKLQLVDDTDKVVSETVSQKDKVFRVVKGYYNGQKMILTKIEMIRKWGTDYLGVLISSE
jgi:hypothetical protein